MNFELYNGDCLDELKKLPDNSIDSCVTDPPYGLSFMGKSWDYDVPSADIWREVHRVLKPGGHLLAFFGSRTYHRGVVQIEDAGFEIRDQIMWLYGSGFPKSHDISKSIDREAGEQREIIGTQSTAIGSHLKSKEGPGPGGNKPAVKSRYTGNVLGDPVTDEAKQWEGWGTALKPAHEPVVVARKPVSEKTIAANVIKHGTGAINIDESRVEHVTVNGGNLADNPHLRKEINGGNGGNIFPTESKRRVVTPNLEGRWPANVIHDGSDEVVSNFPNTGSGNGKGAYNYAGREYDNKETSMFNGDKPQAPSNYNDNGSAARFFYCAKASKSDRDEGNSHPTVKPTDLMKYLVKLVTQKGGTVLDPFMGSGTTGKACGFEGFKFIGIERDKDYFEIAKARIEHAYQNKTVSLEDHFI